MCYLCKSNATAEPLWQPMFVLLALEGKQWCFFTSYASLGASGDTTKEAIEKMLAQISPQVAQTLYDNSKGC